MRTLQHGARPASFRNASAQGFTLIEMLVVAPIVILTIGAFIALIVNLTGDVLSSRGSNMLAYDVQDSLNRMEQDVKLSTGFLAVTNIDMSTTQQGYSATRAASTTPFVNTGGGTGPILILSGLVTNGNPVSLSTRNVYLDNQPASCSDPSADFTVYSKNRPMTMDIVYFIDSSNTLWRRTIMSADYASNSTNCGTPWQQPSCNTAVSSFCKTNDERLLDGVSPSNFSLQYYTNASATLPIADASDGSKTDAVRGSALQPATTLVVALTANKTIAGRDISRAGTLRASRLDTNATSIAIPATPTAAPTPPVVSGVVSDGHTVTFTWPHVANATSYDVAYRINGSGSDAYTTGPTGLDNNHRSFVITSATHTDTVWVQVTAKNTIGSATGSSSLTIPLWAPLVLTAGWSQYDTNWGAPAYTKTKAGVVLLKGLIRSGTIGATFATLPADYRPSSGLLFENSSNQAAGRLDVFPDGTMMVSVGNNAWASLDGINFMASDTTFTNLTLQNSWANYGAYSGDPRWTYASYAVDSLGRVHTRGLVGAGVTTDPTVISTLPTSPSLAPAGYMHIANDAANGHAVFSINSSGQILARGYPNAYLGLQSMFYPAAARTAAGTTCTTQWCALPLLNSWVYYGSPYDTPEYTKSSDGIVIVKGLVKSGSTSAAIASLPAGYCPKERLLFTTSSGSVWGRVDVVPNTPAGTGCQIVPNIVNAAWVSFDTVIFMAEQ